MLTRRTFIKKTMAATAAVGFSMSHIDAFASGKDYDRLTILHTNDVHSRIDPFPAGSKYAGLGGFSKRAKIIQQIRDEESNVLLLDCGDIFQGTPYFNMYGGELEIKLMSEMGYDATTLGNHDFDAGIEGLHQQLPHANFPFLNANYDFRDTLLEGQIRPYKTFTYGALKVGVLGVGIELNGLVPTKLFGNVIYLDPIEQANKVAHLLKKEHDCDLIICLSHLGYQYDSEKVSDVKLAKNSKDIDIILGGHTHTFLDNPVSVSNLQNEPVVINQVGWAGILLGRLDVYFDRVKKKELKKSQRVIISKKTIVK